MSAGTAMRGLAVAALIGVAAWQMRGLWVGPRVDLGPYRALGTVAAEEAVAMLGGKGRLVLVTADLGPEGDPVQAGQVAAFRKALTASREVILSATEEVGMDPVTRMQTGGAIPPDRWHDLQKKHEGVEGWVLFLPYPPIPSSASRASGAATPKVMVVSAMLPGYEALLRSGALQVAIVPRPADSDPGATGAGDGGVRAEFDREYLILRKP